MTMLILLVWGVAFICIQILMVWGLQSKFLNSIDNAITMMKERPEWSKEKRTRYTRIPITAQNLDSIFSRNYLDYYDPKVLNISEIIDSLSIRPNDTLVFFQDYKATGPFYITHSAVAIGANQTAKFNIYFIYDETWDASNEKDIYYNEYIPIDSIVIDSIRYMPNKPDVFLCWDNSTFSDGCADYFLQLSIKDDTIRSITELARIKKYEN